MPVHPVASSTELPMPLLRGVRGIFTPHGLLIALAFAFGSYHLIVVPGLYPVSTTPLRVTHVMLAFSILFILYPASDRLRGTRIDWLFSAVLVVTTLGACLWVLSRWKVIAFSGGVTEIGDFYVGIVILLLVFEAARRGVGAILAGIMVLFLLYPFVAPYMPGVLEGRGASLQRVVLFLTVDTQGVFGIPVGVAAQYIILFTIFGALLSNFRASDFFFEVSTRLTRGLLAANAKSAVLFSTLIGTVSGSAAGNVAVTGTVTIPLMKREGYESHKAAAVEAVASTGGQIMPPVMGAAAFIMAEIVGVPYTAVMLTALLPALLFFGSAFIVVHLEAVKSNLEPGLGDTSDARSTLRVLLQGLPFILSLGTLIGMMLIGYSPFMASLYAMGALLALDIVWRRKLDCDFFHRILSAIADGAKRVVAITAACAAAGVIAGVLGVTGLGSKIALLIENASAGILLVALLLTMVASIVLGMGLPTTAAYLILATVVAPALVQLGVPLLTAHFFVFFYGCISTITPPVALAAYVAGGIADANINKVGWTAATYGAASFVLPFAFVFGPGILMVGEWWQVALASTTALFSIVAMAIAVVGCLSYPLPGWTRMIAAVSSLCLMFQGIHSDVAGLALLGIVIAYDRFRSPTLTQH